MALAQLELNEQQRLVVENRKDSLLVLAGAGTGKTGTLARRVAGLLADGSAKPEEILCLTFTNRACREMTERIQAGLADGLTVRTVHSFCCDMLRRTPQSLTGLGQGFLVCDEEDARETIRTVVAGITGHTMEDHPTAILQRFIGLVKDRQLAAPEEDCQAAAAWLFLHSLEALRKVSVDEKYAFDPKFFHFLGKYGASITEYYNRALAENNTLDFSDLLLMASRLLSGPAAALWCGKYSYVHVDEVQDVSLAEYALISRLCGSARVLLCGDFHQTIYEWRGSSPKALTERFEREFSPVTVHFTQNYRSRPQLLWTAQNFSHHAFGDVASSGFDPHGPDCADVVFGSFDTPAEESDWLFRQIEALGLTDYSRAAILTRNNTACKAVCEQLRLHRLTGRSPVRFMLADELHLFRRPEVKEALAFFRLMLSPGDGESLRRVLTRRAKGVGAATVKALLDEKASASGVRLSDYMDPRTQRTGDFFEPLITALEAGKVVVFDVESTGTDVYTDEIVQMAAIRLAPDGTEAERFERFLKNTIPVGSSETVHHFSDAFLAEKGMEPARALEEFLSFVSGCVIVGHNVAYDMTITAENLRRLGTGLTFSNSWYDTLDLSRRYLPRLPNHKLATVATELKAAHMSSHNAMDDILATAEVLVSLMNTYVLPQADRRRSLYRAYLPRFGEFAAILNGLRSSLPETAPLLLERLEETFRFRETARNDSERANLLLLEDFVADFADTSKTLPQQLTALLELTTLSSSELDRLGKSQNKIPVITVHQSKGCEFDYVFLPVLQDGVFPSYPALKDGQEGEERRVFYVSLTRAKQRVFLSYSRYNAQNRLVQPSRFLKMLAL